MGDPQTILDHIEARLGGKPGPGRLAAAKVLGALALPALAEDLNFGPLIDCAREWLGPEVIARVRARLELAGPENENEEHIPQLGGNWSA